MYAWSEHENPSPREDYFMSRELGDSVLDTFPLQVGLGRLGMLGLRYAHKQTIS